MAAGAGLQLIGSGAHAGHGVISNAAVALVAESVDGRHIQQPCILRTVGCMATDAALRLDRSVLVHKGTARFGVALGADGILIGRSPEVVGLEGAVGIVTIAAADRALIHRMVEGHIEGSFLIAMALEAKFGLFGFEQALRRFRSMDAVAAETADIRLGVGRALEVGVCAGVAAKTGLVNLLTSELVEALDFGDVAAAIDVSFAGTVAALAGDAFSLMFEGETGVGIGTKLLRDIGVTSGAGFLTDEVRRIHRRLWLGS